MIIIIIIIIMIIITIITMIIIILTIITIIVMIMMIVVVNVGAFVVIIIIIMIMFLLLLLLLLYSFLFYKINQPTKINCNNDFAAINYLLLLLDNNSHSNPKATFVQSTRMQRFLEKHLIPVMLVFIGSKMSNH